MSSTNYSNKLDFVDDFSLKIEELGHPRIYGQILGWLLICQPPHQSFSDLVENLNISKASVSNSTRMMLETGLIEKTRVPGERQVYFRIKDGSLIDFMQKQMTNALKLEQITQKGLELLKSDSETDTTRLERANAFHRFLAQQLTNLIEQYKKDRPL